MARFEIAEMEAASLAGSAGSDIFFQLGLMYATGRTVTADRVVAHKWFNLAAMRGNREAARYRQELAAEMSRDEVAQAQRAAREWATRH